MTNVLKIMAQVLLFLATVGSAVAAWLSYETAERSVAIADRAQRFIEQLHLEQAINEAPFLSVLGGRTWVTIAGLPPGTYSSDPDRPQHVAELSLHNSGGRDASPLWVGIIDANESSSYTSEGPWVKTLDSVAKQSDIAAPFDLGTWATVKPTEWVVAIRWGDGPSPQHPGYRRCSPTRFVRVQGRRWEGSPDPAVTVLTAGMPHVLGSLSNRGICWGGACKPNPTSEPDRRLLEAIEAAGRGVCDQP